MKALIITGQYVQDQEFVYPYYRLQEAGFDVDVAAPDGKNFTGFAGVKCVATVPLDFVARDALQWDVLIIPGGVKCMEHLRLQPIAVAFIKQYHHMGGVIGAICSGTQMLITAKLTKGRRISGYYSMRDDIENAGAEFVDAPAVVCDRIVTSPHYKHLGPWMAAVLAEAEKNRRRDAAAFFRETP